MMFIALSGLLVPTAESIDPAWMHNYAEARLRADELERPLVVVLGSGKEGWDKVSREGDLSSDVKKVLAQSYVCVYVDVDKKAGQRLADAFDVGDGPAIVISSPNGRVQAFRHEGKLDNDDLAQYLQYYADPDVVVNTTETVRPARSRAAYESEGGGGFGAPAGDYGNGGRGC
jgi:hypothetical protein